MWRSLEAEMGVIWCGSPPGTHSKMTAAHSLSLHTVLVTFKIAVTTDLTETKEESLIFSLGL